MLEAICAHCHKMIVPRYNVDTGEVRDWVHAMRVPRTSAALGFDDPYYIERFDTQCNLYATPVQP